MTEPAPFGVFSADVPVAPHRRGKLPVRPQGDWTAEDLTATDAPAADPATRGQTLTARRDGLGERFLDVGEDSFWRAPLGSLNRWLEGLVPAAEDYDGTPGADNSRAALTSRARGRVTSRERDRRENYDARSVDDSWNRDEGLSAGDVARGMVSLGGVLGGAIAGDPTSFIAPGKTLLGKIASQTGVAVVADAATQGSEMAEGVRDEYDPLQTGLAVAIVPGTVALEAGVKALAARGAARRAAKSPAGELADEADAAVPPEDQTQQQRAAVAELRREDAILQDSPFTPGRGSAAHREKLADATGALLRGEAPVAPRRRPVSAAEAAARLDADPREQVKRRIARAESGGNDRAKNPLSSATGRYQVIDSTWLRTMRTLGETGTDAALLMKRTNPVSQERVMDRLLNDYGSALRRIGAPETAGNIYLMHFAGTGGGMRILRAEAGRAVESILGKAAIDANPFLRGMTASDAIAWANRKMGGRTGDAPVVARSQFADDAAGDAEWAAAQAEVEQTELAAVAARRDALRDVGDEGGDGTDDVPFDLDDPRGLARDAEPVGMDWEPLPDAEMAELSRVHSLTPEDRGAATLWLRPKQELEQLAKSAPSDAEIDEGEISRELAAELLREHQDYAAMDQANLIDIIRRTLIDQRDPRWMQRVLEGRDTGGGGQAAAIRLQGAMGALKEQGYATGRLAADLGRSLRAHGWSAADAEEVLTARLAAFDRPLRLPAPSTSDDLTSDLADLGLSDELAARVVARDGDVLTIEDHAGYRIAWNAVSEMQRVGAGARGWRALRAAEIENELWSQRRAADEQMWAAIGDSPDILDDPTVAARLDDSMAHDADMWLAEDPDLVVQMADPDSGAPEVRLADAIRDADDDLGAVTAARACMAPPGGGE